MRDEQWIVIPKWERFQHYKDRNPPWIKTYVRQHNDAAYMELSLAERGLLHELRLLYAQFDGVISASKARLRLQLSLKYAHYYAHLESLNHAGFIELRDSKPLGLETENRDIKKNLVGETHKPTPQINPSPNRVCPQCNVKLPTGVTVLDHMRNTHHIHLEAV